MISISPLVRFSGIIGCQTLNVERFCDDNNDSVGSLTECIDFHDNKKEQSNHQTRLRMSYLSLNEILAVWSALDNGARHRI